MMLAFLYFLMFAWGEENPQEDPSEETQENSQEESGENSQKNSEENSQETSSEEQENPDSQGASLETSSEKQEDPGEDSQNSSGEEQPGAENSVEKEKEEAIDPELADKTLEEMFLAAVDEQNAWVPAFQWQSETAWQVPKGNKYIGMWRLGYAPLKRFSMTTTVLPWAVRGANANFRVPIYQGDKWMVGTEFGFLRWDLVEFVTMFIPEDEDVELPVEMVVYINPIYLNVTRKLGERFLVGASVRHHQVTLGSGASSNQDLDVDFNLNVATTNTHLRAQLAWAMSDNWSFWVIRNRLLKQNILAETYNVATLDNGGQLEMFLDSSSTIANFENATATGFRLYYHGKRAEMMFGFDVGQEPLYFVGSVLPEIPIDDKGNTVGLPFLPYMSLGWNF